jgi:hypothetical protein
MRSANPLILFQTDLQVPKLGIPFSHYQAVRVDRAHFVSLQG